MTKDARPISAIDVIGVYVIQAASMVPATTALKDILRTHVPCPYQHYREWPIYQHLLNRVPQHRTLCKAPSCCIQHRKPWPNLGRGTVSHVRCQEVLKAHELVLQAPASGNSPCLKSLHDDCSKLLLMIQILPDLIPKSL